MHVKSIGRLGKVLALACLMTGSATALAGESGDKGDSLYHRLGGLAPISVVVSDFLDALVVDDVLNANPAIDAARKRVPAAYLKFHVTSMVCGATGGPCQYTGRDMKSSHVHLKITEAEWDRMVEIFVGVLHKYEVPEKETNELLAIIGSTKGDIVMSGKGK